MVPPTLAERSKRIDREAIGLYAAITDDYNPIHIDPEFAARTAMGGIIAHGMLSLNLIWQSLEASFGPGGAAGALLDIRFTRPVRADDVVTAGGERIPEEGGRYRVWVRNQRAETVIEGHLTVRPELAPEAPVARRKS
jgi:acyl dehydratase